ncbi:hypothetical protein D2V17_00685 [Aurantiacibacter xanthus]|uniref:DUF2946 domain-containing protein n=1 Tax=Aurantiacibacter xanthus TaxID=1784712 RepID=A0A3A1PHR6_9SPHN|nr:DUF2946 family protein [Aurantiacibacter xanthus]RIV93368.1 hypothetical protein D2V17_00685 [Aurantiacibacter xanthus]
MQPLRAFLDRRHSFALVLVVLAFCIKALMPAGYMVSSSPDKVLTITICSDVSQGFKQMQLTVPGKPAGPEHSEAGAKSEHCAFAGLGHVAIGGADGFLLALAFAFILVLGLAPSPRLPFGELAHLRPPLRGPPAAA